MTGAGGRWIGERPADAADRRAAPPALRPAAAQAAGPLPRSPSRSTERLALTPPAGTDDVLEMRPVLRVVPRRRLAANAAALAVVVIGILMLSTVVLHTRLSERQLEIDRLEREVGERPRRVRRAPPAARRAARAHPPGLGELAPRDASRAGVGLPGGRPVGARPGARHPRDDRSQRRHAHRERSPRPGATRHAPRPTAWSSSRGATALARTQPGGTTARSRRPSARLATADHPRRRPISGNATGALVRPPATGRPDGAPRRAPRRRPGAAAAA